MGHTPHLVNSNRDIMVVKKLGQGGQGVVYLVRDGNKEYAMKWYHTHVANEALKKSLMEIIKMGAPGEPELKAKFIWPIDMVVANKPGFGYIMPLINTKKYVEMNKVFNGVVSQPTFETMCEISYQMCSCYRALHRAGLCYRDISFGNIMVDTVTGNILICDNDNVSAPSINASGVLGTLEFMAPEIILRKSKPTVASDLHSLAVFLHYLWMWHHPFHGDMESNIRSWDIPAKKLVYGEKPTFIFDPNNKTNRPNCPEYGTVRKRWAAIPEDLQKMFIRSFVDGIDPNKRIMETEWVEMFLTLKDRVITCPSCFAVNLLDSSSKGTCWHCKSKISPPVHLEINNSGKKFVVPMFVNGKLMEWHLSPSIGRETMAKLIGEVVEHPKKKGVFGLKNRSSEKWKYQFDGSSGEIDPDRSIAICSGTEIEIGRVKVTIR